MVRPPLPVLSVIIPAHDEAATIGACLAALRASEGPEACQVVVVANGCADDTAQKARSECKPFAARGWQLEVIERAEAGKPGALNAGDSAALGRNRVYLDADVRVSPTLLAQIVDVLDTPQPRYVSGRLKMPRPSALVSRAYARVWAQVPFMTSGVPGAGLFAVNAAGRARWGDWPEIISDDTFARLHFAPDERLMVPASYHWPVVEGLGNLIRVRRRQNRGVAQIAALYPELLDNADTGPLSRAAALRLGLRDPIGMAVYGGVALAVRLTRGHGGTSWRRGR